MERGNGLENVETMAEHSSIDESIQSQVVELLEKLQTIGENMENVYDLLSNYKDKQENLSQSVQKLQEDMGNLSQISAQETVGPCHPMQCTHWDRKTSSGWDRCSCSSSVVRQPDDAMVTISTAEALGKLASRLERLIGTLLPSGALEAGDRDRKNSVGRRWSDDVTVCILEKDRALAESQARLEDTRRRANFVVKKWKDRCDDLQAEIVQKREEVVRLETRLEAALDKESQASMEISRLQLELVGEKREKEAVQSELLHRKRQSAAHEPGNNSLNNVDRLQKDHEQARNQCRMLTKQIEKQDARISALLQRAKNLQNSLSQEREVRMQYQNDYKEFQQYVSDHVNCMVEVMVKKFPESAIQVLQPTKLAIEESPVQLAEMKSKLMWVAEEIRSLSPRYYSSGDRVVWTCSQCHKQIFSKADKFP